MSDDPISRQAAIDAINKAFDRETLVNAFVRKVAVDAVKAIPSEPEKVVVEVKVDTDEIMERLKEEIFPLIPQWIPCSERLPEIKDECYFVDDSCELYESDEVIVYADHAEPWSIGIAVMVLDKMDGQMEWSGYVGDLCASSCDIVAWMPLPKPYREEGDNETN